MAMSLWPQVTDNNHRYHLYYYNVWCLFSFAAFVLFVFILVLLCFFVLLPFIGDLNDLYTTVRLFTNTFPSNADGFWKILIMRFPFHPKNKRDKRRWLIPVLSTASIFHWAPHKVAKISQPGTKFGRLSFGVGLHDRLMTWKSAKCCQQTSNN